ncbi:MAG: 2-oxo acid dehydrogenase subunit E2 [Pseudomonadota bacterium]
MTIHTIKLPDVGEGVTEAEFVELHVAVGDMVEPDQNLADVMTDKATVEVPSPRKGKVVWIGPEPGEVIAVGSEIIKLELEGGAAADDAGDEEEFLNPMEAMMAAERAEKTASPEPAPAPVAALSTPSGAYTIKLPDVGEGVTEAEFVEIHVKVGDRVRADQNLADVMTDKATVEIPSPRDGVVAWIGADVGETVAVGSEIIKLEVEGAEPAAAEAAPAPQAEEKAPAPVQKASGGKVLAAPAVRARAMARGIDLATVKGTGPEGRITHQDLDNHTGGAVAKAPAAPMPAPRNEVEEIKVIGLRRKIAEKMHDSMRRIPHFTYVDEVDMTALEELRQHMNKTKRDDQPKLTVLPYICRAVILAIRDFPQMNARFDDDEGIVRRYAAAHLGIATQTDNGLIVPVLRHAETMDLWQMADEIKRVSTAARDGSAKREELSGSSITITSLGPLGGVTTTPVINHPEVGIIGPNKIQTVPRFNAMGQVEARKVMNLSSSFDHRVVDGYDAAEFIQVIKGYLEYPATLFV